MCVHVLCTACLVTVSLVNCVDVFKACNDTNVMYCIGTILALVAMHGHCFISNHHL